VSRGRRPVALITDLGDQNPGPSVTNAIESVISALVRRGFVPPVCEFIEHYDASQLGPAFNAVSLSDRGDALWTTLALREAAEILRCHPSELTLSALDDGRLVADIGRLRHSLYPWLDLARAESTPVIQRRLEIERTMTSKAELRAAVRSRAKERTMQKLIHRDPSLLGEIYARRGSYICFAEFSIGDGAVDFVVLSGQSRMDVFLIEVKGAEFHLQNRNHYREFNAKINEAAGQIRERYNTIYRAYEQYRQHFHHIRAQVEKGRHVRGSFAGPDIPLGVDPRKDISVHCVVIGGRMRNDVAESQKRNTFEERSTPPIRIESWDSWLNKLQRE
jgi:hypothetical protein